MSDNVVPLPVMTKLDVPPAKVLEGAALREFERVLVIGRLADGEEFLAMSDADMGTALFDMERAKHKMMRLADDV